MVNRLIKVGHGIPRARDAIGNKAEIDVVTVFLRKSQEGEPWGISFREVEFGRAPATA